MRSQYHRAQIEMIIDHSEDLRSFIFATEEKIKSNPGQFVMVWLPGVDEKPISLSNENMITVKKIGPFTEKLFEKKEGEHIEIRGPYGNSFPSAGKNTVVGGGCGIAPLAYYIERYCHWIAGAVLAGKTKSDLIFLEDIMEHTNVVAVTEDGSHGIKGLATDAEIPEGERYLVCGPEIMMQKVAEKLIDTDVDPKRICVSMERYMKCAVGICGNCSFSGYRVCADGPIFRYDQVKDAPHFNKYERIRTGELVKKI